MRRNKDPPEPLDIDLAIEVRVDDPEDAFTAFFDVAQRLDEKGQGIHLQTDDLTDSRSKWFTERQRGVLILDRDKEGA